MKNRKSNLKIDVSNANQTRKNYSQKDTNKLQQEPDSYKLTNSGTFAQGDLTINERGMLVDGQSPKSSPVNTHNAVQLDHVPQTFEFTDFEMLKIVGRGSSGVVQKALHRPTKDILALKAITLDIKEDVRKLIISELKTLHKIEHSNIITFYDAFYSQGSIYIALEYMDRGSLADLLTTTKTIPEDVLAKITKQTLLALRYLHKTVHLIHRDIKPANMLINNKGEMKITDFGVSSQLVHTLSHAVTWVGTVTYMSPERISALKHSYNSDLWSLGLTLVEFATGRFPYPPKNEDEEDEAQDQPMLFWDLLNFIVKEPAPILPSEKFSKQFCSFVSDCLKKDPKERSSSTVLLKHPFLSTCDNVDLRAWMESIREVPN